MAEVHLKHERALDPQSWPSICVRCDQPATEQVLVPSAFSTGPSALTVPVCDKHRDHWQAYQWSARIAGGLLLIVAVCLAVGCWQFLASRAGWPLRSLLEQVLMVVGLTGAGTVLIGAPLMVWVGSQPVRVVADAIGDLTLKGVSWQFTQAWAERERQSRSALPPVDPQARFPVEPYRPDGACPWPGVLYVLALPLLLGSIAGIFLVGASLGLRAVTDTWPHDDPRYVALAALICIAYAFALAFAFVRVGSEMRPRVVASILVTVVFMVGFASLIVWALGLFSFPILLDLALYVPVLVIVATLLSIWLVDWGRVRQSIVAGFGSFLGPAALVGVALLFGAGWDKRSIVLIGIGAFAAFMTVLPSAFAARRPFCVRCDRWMDRRSLGYLGRSCAEIKPILSAGEIVRLVGELVLSTGGPRNVELVLHSCAQCQESSQVVLELIDLYEMPKGATGHRTAGKWTYPGAALGILEKVFPPSPPTSQTAAEK